ncbi:MAG TPA: hypothetical protein VES59_11500 [Bacteroidota bacterium]|nr:hypothetical protein [Bacteroidota bacterium]
MPAMNRTFPILLSSVVGVGLLSGFAYFASHRYHKEVPRSVEKELKVTLSAGFGDVAVARGTRSAVLDADIESEKGIDVDNFVEYAVRDHIGYVTINTHPTARLGPGKHSVSFEGFHSDTWKIRLTDDIPISFDINLGLGKGMFDMTGLRVKDLKISAGASSVWLAFGSPNKTVIEDLTLESGLCKFSAEGLCNANFNHMKFEGGVGSYLLDFGGMLSKEVDVDIQVGLGSLTVRIPGSVGARIIYEKSWIAHIDLDPDFSELQENNYFSSNYRTAAGKMNIKIDAGLGRVKIQRE